MSEAENKWTKWDIERFQFWQHDLYSASRESREAYKSALRREIEKKRQSLKKSYPNFPPAFSTKEIFEIIDTVEP